MGGAVREIREESGSGHLRRNWRVTTRMKMRKKKRPAVAQDMMMKTTRMRTAWKKNTATTMLKRKTMKTGPGLTRSNLTRAVRGVYISSEIQLTISIGFGKIGVN